MASSGSSLRHYTSALWLLVTALVAVPVACSVVVNEDYEGPDGRGGGGGAGGEVLPPGCFPEVCDGFDNDCDGDVDEDCTCDPGDMQSCYTGNPITMNIGNCQSGQQVCDANGAWGPCSGEIRPEEEVCDIYDNDCDGFIDEVCPCDDGQTQPCYPGNPITRGIGNCVEGTQVCVDGWWDPTCTGAVGPTIEICNGEDDDCDGATDLQDVPAEMLCPPVANGDPDCVSATCVIASCDTDYADANGQYADGCECHANPLTSEGPDCANAINLGPLTDQAQDLQNRIGNGGPAGRSIWYTFQAIDDLDTAGDEFHVDVRFMVNPSQAYAMDVYRGGCAGGDQVATAETEAYDFYTDFPYTTVGCTQGPPCGEGNCVPAPLENEQTCDDQSAVFYVRVFRVDGAASCEAFTLEFSNGVR